MEIQEIKICRQCRKVLPDAWSSDICLACSTLNVEKMFDKYPEVGEAFREAIRKLKKPENTKKLVEDTVGTLDEVLKRRKKMAIQSTYETKFVEQIPENLEDGVLYVAPHHEVAMHSCMCGCGERICNPLGRGFWSWTFDGKNVSISPSIIDRSCPNKFHYYLQDGKVRWY